MRFEPFGYAINRLAEFAKNVPAPPLDPPMGALRRPQTGDRLMRKPLRAALVAAASATLTVSAVTARAELQGDEKAVALAIEMMEAMGGREIWADAVWMYAEERSMSLNHIEALAYRGWRGLQHPQGGYSVENAGFSYRQGWTTAGGWRVLNGEFLEFSGERLAEETRFWPKEIYTMYRRFAAGDDDLRLISTGERRFRIEDVQSGAALGEFSVSPEGGPLVWRSGDAEIDVTYVYGPLKSFGDIKLPAWGAQTNGAWRFNYVAARLFDTPMPAEYLELPARN